MNTSIFGLSNFGKPEFNQVDPLPGNTHEFVIFDSGIDQIQQLIDGVKPGIDWAILNPNLDGIEQITRILANYSEITTLHIVSHGAPGCLFLGNTQLSLDTLKDYTTQLQRWFKVPLTKGDLRGSLLLYGCKVAAGDAGVEFIQKLHNITQASIAASRTLTGNPQQGGNWNLEATVGSYQPRLAFTSQTQAIYAGVLETKLVKDIYPNGDSNPDYLTAVGDKVFFRASDGSNGKELWVSDGTEAGTRLVKDIWGGSNTSDPDYLTAVGDKVFFSADDDSNGHELWVSDGTEYGTGLVKDIYPDFLGSSPFYITAVGDKVFFAASDGSNGRELWVSDGTEYGGVS
ncbi:MAG: ELWxxDGT repeat protein [Microcoleaceae cyanobacterium]